MENEDLVDVCERNLQVAVEAAIDVGEALIAYMGWRAPKSYSDVATILLENKVIDEPSSEQFKKAVSIRNILVHNYVYLEPKELYAHVESFIDSLTRIVNTVVSYMRERNIDP